jgi:hypothetical protein
MRGLGRHRATRTELFALRLLGFALLLLSDGCSTDAVVIGSDSTEPSPLGIGLAGRDTSGVDPSKRVKDLSADEARAWCEWFSRVFPLAGGPTPEDVPVEPGGFVSGYGAIGCETLSVCTVHLSVNHCVGNLALEPCEATLAELDSCLGVMWGFCQLPERCEPFLAAPACSETIIAALSAPDVHPICRIRVE